MYICVCVCVRAHAGDSQRFLEDGLAGKLSLYCHGYQPGGGWQGEFIVPECVCVYAFLSLFVREAKYL